ncbi:MAG: hypothetical protein IPL84_00115 [Chitinophagaceae bacterium]|nr:hypothetical protein [Chitinophagaceae bacterium]
MSRRQKKGNVKTYSENIINFVWVNFGVCMLIISIIVAKSNNWKSSIHWYYYFMEHLHFIGYSDAV